MESMLSQKSDEYYVDKQRLCSHKRRSLEKGGRYET